MTGQLTGPMSVGVTVEISSNEMKKMIFSYDGYSIKSKFRKVRLSATKVIIHSLIF